MKRAFVKISIARSLESISERGTMSRLFTLTTVYMDATILAASLAQANRTGIQNLETRWLILNHAWPIDPQSQKISLLLAARQVSATVFTLDKNIGGHEGFNYLLNQTDFQDDDFILEYDADSWPLVGGWAYAMKRCLDADPTLGYVSLLSHEIPPRPWHVKAIAGYRVGFLPEPEMWNVTMFRGSVLRQGMVANSKFYGHVEVPMQARIKAMGMRNGYLLDFPEGKHPIPHHALYSEWKKSHAAGTYPKNFDEYYLERS